MSKGKSDELFMAEAVRLAQKAEGRTSPNPPVGSVVVANGEIAGRGFHEKAGKPHAEVIALDNAGKRAKNSTIYVTLEPCNHHGRTPPCTEKIINCGIKRVVIGSLDPNPEVAGGGVEKLRSNGISVEYGVLKSETDYLLAPFAKHITTRRPWVILKMAASLDGKIACRPGIQHWLTGLQASEYVHSLRNTSEAIMVGSNTILIDNPELTTRSIKNGQNPLRVVIDSKLKISPDSKVITGSKAGCPAGGGCLIYTSSDSDENKNKALQNAGAEVTIIPHTVSGLDMDSILNDLGKRGVMKLLVEGGPSLAGHMIKNGFIDEINFLYAPQLIGGDIAPGLLAGKMFTEIEDCVDLEIFDTKMLGKDLLIKAFVKKQAELCLPD